MLFTWETAIIATVGYYLVIHLYRLFFHPLAKFPGPRIAAASFWYEFYYDVVRCGRYHIKIAELHEKYGPIVRINPEEIHVLDSDFVNTLYAPQTGKKPDKYESFYSFASIPNSAFSAGSHDLHHLRRGSMAKFFSPKAVKELEPMVTERVEALSRQFSEAAATGDPINVDHVLNAVSMDIVSVFCFGQRTNHIADKAWAPKWRNMTGEAFTAGPLFRAFPIIPTIIKTLPEGVLKMNVKLSKYHDWVTTMRQIVDTVLADEDPKSQSAFHAIRDNHSLPAAERGRDRLLDEAIFFTAAGIDTIMSTFLAMIYYLINNEEAHKTLRRELSQAMPDPNKILTYQELRQLPYLSACIQEGLRMGNAAASRLPRVIRQPLAYKDWVIPAGTPVSQSLVDVQHDPKIFPEPYKYAPERWLGPPGRDLERYQVAFGKGSRACLGLHMAYSQLYLVMGTVFRRFDLELFDTSVKDVEMYHDYFVPQTETERGVRVRVRMPTTATLTRRDSAVIDVVGHQQGSLRRDSAIN